MPVVIEISADGQRATPLAYSVAVREQFAASAGCYWVHDRGAANKSGYYTGDLIALESTLAALESARVAKLRRLGPAPGVTALAVAAASSAPAADLPPLINEANLKGFQRDGVRWLLAKLQEMHSAILADEVGTGKTRQAISTMLNMRPEITKVIVIAPAIVGPHWRAEHAKSDPDGRIEWEIYSYEKMVNLLRGVEKIKKENAEVRSGKREGEIKQIPALPWARGVILDEVHFLMNSRSKRSKYIEQWLRGLSPQPYILGLSGTLIPTRVRNLWNQLNILFPRQWGSYFQFTQRYAAGAYVEVENVGSFWTANGSSNTEELNRRLKRVALRRTKLEVAGELPPQLRIVVPIELKAADVKKVNLGVGAALSGPLSVGAGGGADQKMIHALGIIEGAKASAAIEYTRQLRADGSRVLVLTLLKKTAAVIAEAFGIEAVDGEVPIEQRKPILDACAGVAATGTADTGAPMESDGDGGNGELGGVGVATLFSVQVGIDLTEYDAIVFVGLSNVPAHLLQAEGRLHRMSSKQAEVTYHYLIALGTADEVVRERVIERLTASVEILGGENEQQLANELAGNEQDLIDQILTMVKAKAA